MRNLNCLQQTKKSFGLELRGNMELFNGIKKKTKKSLSKPQFRIESKKD